MRTALIVSALAALAAAAPRPQDIDFGEIDSEPRPTETGPSPTDVSDPVDYSLSAAKASASAAVTDDLTSGDSKRDLVELQSLVERAQGDCAPQPNGYGPKPATDTVDAFKSYQTFHDTANNAAATPQGYSLSFKDLYGSSNANTYLGLYTLKTYDTIKCQQLCDAVDLCGAFNIYFERDPSLDPGDTCPNPPSFTNVKCTLWGSNVTPQTAKNTGQWRRQFQVVIAGSNGYSKDNPPSPIDGWTGPTRFGGAINAPSTNGQNTYLGVKYFPGVYDAGKCAGAASATTAYNSRHPRADGSYDKVVFFNAYLLSKNNVPDGTYCSLYSKTWGKPYDDNVGQYRGSDYYSVSSSYGFTVK